MKFKIVLISIVVIMFFTGAWVLGSYNNLITKNEEVATTWADVETQYQRRFDVIPNLTNATKGYLKQEQQVFGDIAKARTNYAGTNSNTDERVEATNGLNSALSRLLVIIENYPDLKSNQTVQSLIDEIAGTENRINVARIRYNEITKVYNITIKRFPTSLLASIFRFDEKKLFDSVQEAATTPVVNLE